MEVVIDANDDTKVLPDIEVMEVKGKRMLTHAKKELVKHVYYMYDNYTVCKYVIDILILALPCLGKLVNSNLDEFIINILFCKKRTFKAY